MSEITEELKKIKDEVVECEKCDLYKTRTLPVVGVGSHDAKIMFIGEAPGANEDATGVPFCGAAGKILDELLGGIGIRRENVYICNILKDRPPGNRDPKKEEIEACTPYLERQIQAIRPLVIGTLGNYATAFILKKLGLQDKVQGISRIHGQVFSSDVFYPVKIIPLYHPAVVTYNANMKDTLAEDFKVLKKFGNLKKETDLKKDIGMVKLEQDKLF